MREGDHGSLLLIQETLFIFVKILHKILDNESFVPLNSLLNVNILQ